MTDTWHTELTQDGDRWSFTLMQNGIWHSGGRNYRSRTAALQAAEIERLRGALETIARKDIHREGFDIDAVESIPAGAVSRTWIGPCGRIARAALTGEDPGTARAG